MNATEPDNILNKGAQEKREKNYSLIQLNPTEMGEVVGQAVKATSDPHRSTTNSQAVFVIKPVETSSMMKTL